MYFKFESAFNGEKQKRGRIFDPLSDINISALPMSKRYTATDEIPRESKLQSCMRNNIRHSPEEISVAS